jgi:hypothetical protein
MMPAREDAAGESMHAHISQRGARYSLPGKMQTEKETNSNGYKQ